MRSSRLFINTLRDDPTEAEVTSHRLMLRAGLIRQLSSGIFSWLPLGLRSVRKIEKIIREEMNKAGAAEIKMPAIQPAELWQDSGRWEMYGPELLRLKDRHQRDYCVGPTHEEVVTEMVAANVTSWRQLPFNLYQIQTKFRDEIRPRHGIMRSREFVMKDAYSFDKDQEGAQESYRIMRDTYIRIFDRIGLEYRVVQADSGAIGGSQSEEFLVLADTGEAVLAHTEKGYVANLEEMPCAKPEYTKRDAPSAELEEIDTPGINSIEQLQEFLPKSVPMSRSVKTIIVAGEKGLAAVLLAGDAQLNLAKASKIDAIGAGARLAEHEEVAKAIGANIGSLGPVNMPLPVVADFGLLNSTDFVCGANRDDKHLLNANFGRDCPEPIFADLRNAEAGEIAPDGLPITLGRGIEVGHVFYLGTKYSAALSANFEDSSKNINPIEMGCYGIGITRIVAAAIEQNNDEAGIIFPESIAPFQVAILPIGDESATKAAVELYEELQKAGVDVLFDDRNLRPGAAFADLDLLGIPHRVVVSKRNLDQGKIEHKRRGDAEPSMINVADAASKLAKLLAN